MFTQIHEIVFHGKGGYDWHTVYNMPRWLRQFTFNKIDEFYKKEHEEYEKSRGKSANKSTLIDPTGKINKENWKGVPKPITPGAPSKSKVKYG